MNKVILIGRLTRDPKVHYSTGEHPMAVARYTLVVGRFSKSSRNDEKTAYFIRCVVFHKPAEFADNYLTKGIKIAVTGHIRTGSYTNCEGQVVYTTDIVVESQEFCQSKAASSADSTPASNSGFMDIPNGIDEKLPFN